MSSYLTIMHVEDDLLDQLKLKKALSQIDYNGKVHAVQDAKTALKNLKETKNNLPHIILLDLNMPNMNGQEFLTEIKADIRLKHIPVIILSNSNHKQDIKNSYKKNAAGYFVKPFLPTDYCEVIKQLSDYWHLSELSAVLET